MTHDSWGSKCPTGQCFAITVLANELGLIYKAKTKIISFVMTWDGVVTSYHKKYIQELNVQPTLEAYIQSDVLKKTLESISLDRRHGLDQEEMERKRWREHWISWCVLVQEEQELERKEGK
jgi:hypothetical protein